MGGIGAGGVDNGGGIGGHSRHAAGAGRNVAAAGPAIVEGDGAIVGP